MQILTGLNAPSALEAATRTPNAATNWSTARDEIRDDAKNALRFAQAKMSLYYDKRHKAITFKKDDLVYVRLSGSMEPGYHLPNEVCRKLSQQRVGPFKVIEPVGQLAYKLELPKTWKLHPVLSVAHLEPHTPDTFSRTNPTPTPDVVVGHDGQPEEEWEIEDVIRDRYNKRRKRKEYYVKWKDFGPEHNTWEPEENLLNSPEILDRYLNRDSITTIASTFFLPSPSVVPIYHGSICLDW
jgi:hypothetical protein